ncbi:MAG: GIY-YIG nuclease family protein [Candidatus Omnitrophica bacterium]|nr:GIY-YIG nuclease family protein [Candidatus Omnitrophota bacterium]
MAVSWFVYLLECEDSRLYTGITNNLERRLKQHNKGKGCRFTRARFPVKIIHKEEYTTKEEALKREAAIKKLTRFAKLELVRIKTP